MLLKTVALIVFVVVLTSFGYSQVIPLTNGFSHNDYLHRRPLFDALDNGYTNIEADVFLHHNKLIVAHFFPYFKQNRTLEKLYLEPLSKHITENNGEVYKNYEKPVILMIDIKSDADNTYNALKPLLEKYASILSVYDGGKLIPGKITVVLSGNKPYKLIRNEQKHIAFIDEDLKRTKTDTINSNIFILASCKYSHLLKWNGRGVMPVKEHDNLCSYIAIAHRKGEKVRLWASPENPRVWEKLLNCGVDCINTDKLKVLKNYLIAYNVPK